METNQPKMTVSENMSEIVRLTKTIKTLSAQREDLIRSVYATLKENGTNTAQTVGGDTYKFGDDTQFAVNPAYEMPSDLLNRLIEMKTAQIVADPLGNAKVSDLIALGIPKKDENVGEDKPYMKKAVLPRMTQQ